MRNLHNIRIIAVDHGYGNQIVEYVVHNGLLKDMSVLQSPPFTDQGSVVDIFPDLSVWQGIRAVIKQINANAGVA